MILSATGVIFALIVFLAFFGLYASVPSDPNRPPSIMNLIAAVVGSLAAGVAAGMFWTLLEAPVAWP